ncbi:hypothetical protein NMY22_g7319 [Coprinellus aureogranulatus]|nr:hypothetical protein NMY22_g7319 [Coprinellus aureogranulatus]
MDNLARLSHLMRQKVTPEVVYWLRYGYAYRMGEGWALLQGEGLAMNHRIQETQAPHTYSGRSGVSAGLRRSFWHSASLRCSGIGERTPRLARPSLVIWLFCESVRETPNGKQSPSLDIFGKTIGRFGADTSAEKDAREDETRAAQHAPASLSSGGPGSQGMGSGAAPPLPFATPTRLPVLPHSLTLYSISTKRRYAGWSVQHCFDTTTTVPKAWGLSRVAPRGRRGGLEGGTTNFNHPLEVLVRNQNRYENSPHNQSYHTHGDTHNVTTIYNDRRIEGVQRAHERALQRLESKISRGAAHDSAERGPYAPKCDEGTREAVQDDILSWIDRGIENLLWLTGPAGTGKSAIAGSIADKFRNSPGSLFEGVPVPHPRIPLIQLNIAGLREEVLCAIDTFPSVFDKRLDDQLRILILEPLRNVNQAVIKSSTFKTIIIDGVDECKEDRRKTDGTEQGGQKAGDAERDRHMSKEGNHRQIISSLVRASQDPSFPFRIIIVSRPERAIEQSFTSLPSGAFKHIFLDDKYNPTADIELYLRAKFDTIGRTSGLPDHWYRKPSEKDVPGYLAQEASGQFIYAATVVRYIQDGTETPHEQLKRVLNWKGPVKTSDSRPFAALDALYTGILKGSPGPTLSTLWLRAISIPWATVVEHIDQFDGNQPSYQKALLEASPGQTQFVLGRLTALVGLSDNHGQPAFTLYHKSLTDFLKDKDRSGDLHLEEEEVLQFLDERYYKVLKNRGPQGWLPPDLQKFNRAFSSQLWPWLDLSRRYDASSVDWWIAPLLDPPHANTLRNISRMFANVHAHCHWYHCLPACRSWRKGILRHLKGIGYPVPTRSDLFLSKFQTWEHLGGIRLNNETIKSFCAARGIEVQRFYGHDGDTPVQPPSDGTPRTSDSI